MKKIITLLVPLFLTAWLTEQIANASPPTNGEPAHILIEAAVLTATLNPHANSSQDNRSQAVVLTNLFLPEAVSWFTNFVPVIGQRNGVQYIAKFKDPLSMTVAALADEYSVTVLQRPRILTSDGKIAQFWVGESFPYILGGNYPNISDRSGFILEATPRLDSKGFIEMNIRWDDAETISTTNLPTLVSMTNSASITVNEGEVFMANCAMNPSPEQVSIFRKSARAFSALFGRPTRKPDKKEIIVLFRARQVANLNFDNQGRPIFLRQ